MLIGALKLYFENDYKKTVAVVEIGKHLKFYGNCNIIVKRNCERRAL